jgi:hypothetical protein
MTFSSCAPAEAKGEPAMTQTITPIEKVLYTAKAHTTGGREGGASRTKSVRIPKPRTATSMS